MLNSTIIKSFFNKYDEGYINIVQSDCVFKVNNDIDYSCDETSIKLFGVYYIDKKYGNARKGNFMIPFNQILRIEYIHEYKEI